MMIPNILNSKNNIRVSVGVIIFIMQLAIAQAIELDSQTLRYSVMYTTHAAGEMEIVIERDGDQIKTTAISHLSAVVKLFLTGLTAEAWFRVEENVALLQGGHILSHDNKSIKQEFKIDHQNSTLTYKPGETKSIDRSELFESTIFPIGLITSNIQSVNGQLVREVNAKQDRGYIYLTPIQEEFEHHGKTFDTWKVVRHKQGDPTRTVTLWLDRNNQNIPLKIVTTRKKKDTIMTLISQ